MSSQVEETEILRALYAGTAGGFEVFLWRVAGAVRAHGAVLAVAANGRWTLGSAPGLPSLSTLRDGRVYAQGDLPGSDPSDSPLRLVALRSVAVPVILALSRQRADFRAADGALLSRLAPHLETAALLWRQRQAEVVGLARDGALMAGLGAGWVVLDQGLRLVEAGPGAEAILSRAGLLPGADGRLDLPSETARALRRAVEGALTGKASVVTLSTDPGVEAALRPEDGQALALLRATPQAGALPDLPGALGLTRSESRLVAALTDGATLAEAAKTLGWSVETARSTSKQVFSKLGVSGQPSLMRRVLNGAHWLLP